MKLRTGFITLFLLFNTGKLFGQNDTIGYLDSLGRKQNIWMEIDSLKSQTIYYRYKDGILNGVTTHESFDGKYIYLLNYKNDVLNGISNYYVNRRIEKIFCYDNGELVHEILFLKGKIWIETTYKNGLADGLSIVYRKGKPHIVRTNKNGKKNGEEIIYKRKNKINYYVDGVLQK